MGRKPSISPAKRFGYHSSSSTPVNDLQGNTLSQGSTPESSNSDSTYSQLPIQTRRQRIQAASESRKKRKHSLHVDSLQTISLSQENPPDAVTSILRSAPLHDQTIPQWMDRKKRKQSAFLALLTPVKNQEMIELRVINSKVVCHHCGAKKFEYESPTFCCDNGKIRLAHTIMPHELFELFTDTQSPEAENFRKRIRVYNSIFSFTSFGVKVDTNLASSTHGIYTFRVLGQVFHTLPPLTPRDGKPSHFQLYFWDNINELANRMSVFDNADICEDTMQILVDVMKKNPYAELLHRINDFPSIEDVTLQICKNAGVDQRCYNKPTADQVAAIWIEGNNPNIPYDRDILLHGSNGQKHRIKHYFGCYDPLQYPLLFPSGENGWHQNIPKFRDDSIVQQSHHTNTNPIDFSSMETILRAEQPAC